MSLVLIIISVCVVITLISGIVLYNALVRRRNFCQNSFAQIDVQLTRRHELIPNLVNVAKEYLRHESEVLRRVIEARGKAQEDLNMGRENIGQLESMQALGASEGSLNRALQGFQATVEGYPELKASKQMRDLSDELTHTENRVMFARQAYNDAVMEYNNARESFPSNIVSSLFQFQPMAKLDLVFNPEAPNVFE